jgi:hypothetical protein
MQTHNTYSREFSRVLLTSSAQAATTSRARRPRVYFNADMSTNNLPGLDTVNNSEYHHRK